ncbi:malate dehydrogenase [Actinomycetospora termitidis]|uniref:Malate dehydrogenase n=1 Tax=Actinomycetospora termitidis TaxID=3053470 RepID=A0ABT7MGC7_9PSEU|nr:malate dehydrogenase [Actinomycetospora sp. Odt1-22]MDL5159710.1 malate dehydrogenase [Actinomycetospora sp. Odt1-22]
MNVWGASDVDAAAARGATLRVGPRDVVTPLARERARELGVTIADADGIDRPASSPATPVPDLADRGTVHTMRPPSPALFRRGAPLPGGLAPDRSGGTERVVVVGAGHVGMIAAMRLADADVFDEVVLVDIDEGRAAGIALDLQHTAALSDFATRVRGVGTVEEAGPADYVVITAGRPRQPGMTRADLVSTNAAIVGDLARRVAATSPRAVVVVVTNPLDEMTQHAWTSSGFPSSRVLGMAGVLDTARFQALVALEDGAGRARSVDAIALGSHGEEMVIPLSRATAGGRPLPQVVPPVRLNAVVDRARGSGGEVVGLLKTGSAFLAPGMSAARMVLAMVRESDEVMSAAVLADGSYGIRDVYLGLPVRLGRQGLREIVTIPLAPEELAALREAGDRIRERLGAMPRAS